MTDNEHTVDVKVPIADAEWILDAMREEISRHDSPDYLVERALMIQRFESQLKHARLQQRRERVEAEMKELAKELDELRV